ncbi:hypothetical protein ACGFZK_22555 [Streptomyces sp. NPDC048257]|uniref:hypothetical protein n=1 Tax=Streptomyces sp. NPDC048257 TaxID=3365526 RepID=UPI00371BA8D5
MSTRPSGFENRLKAALLARLPEVTPAPAPTRARRYGIPLAVGIATAVVVAVMALPGSTHHGSRPADGPTKRPANEPEIKKDPDGSLRFKMPEHDQIPSLVDQLKARGVSVALVPMRPRSQCSELGGGYRGPQADREAEVLQHNDDEFVLKVNAKTVPPGHTLTIRWSDYYPLGEQGFGFGVVESSKVPSCSIDYSEGLEELLRSGAASKDPGPTVEVPVPTAAELPEVVRTLQAQGVSVMVTEKKPKSECTHEGGGYRGPQADPEAEISGRRPEGPLRINSKTVPPGYTLVFTKWARASGPGVGYGVKETSKVTPCEIDYFAGDGAPPAPPSQ